MSLEQPLAELVDEISMKNKKILASMQIALAILTVSIANLIPLTIGSSLWGYLAWVGILSQVVSFCGIAELIVGLWRYWYES